MIPDLLQLLNNSNAKARSAGADAVAMLAQYCEFLRFNSDVIVLILHKQQSYEMRLEKQFHGSSGYSRTRFMKHNPQVSKQ